MKDLTQPVALLLQLILILLLGLLVWRQFATAPSLDDQDYVAVLLTTGVAYYGRPSSYDDEFLVLTDTHYVRQVQNQETDAVSNVLVKRGQEVHGPDRMIIPLVNVQFIETVAPDSEIATKIRGD